MRGCMLGLRNKLRISKPDLTRIAAILFCLGCFVIFSVFILDVSPSNTFSTFKLNSVESGECGRRHTDLLYIGESTDVITPNMSQSQADIIFHRYIAKLHFVCKNSIRLGNRLDGGWDMCLVGPYTPASPCLVYSIGINNDFSFDDAVAKTFGCTVRSFDPSMTVKAHRRSANVWFHKIGLSGEDGVNNKSWTVKTLKSLLESFNEHNKVIDYLKFDIEWSEWPALESMLKTDVLSRVKQLAMEVHTTVKKEPTTAFLYSSYKLLDGLERIGFRRWHFSTNLYNLERRKNGFRSCCYEMIYINTNYLPNWTPR